MKGSEKGLHSAKQHASSNSFPAPCWLQMLIRKPLSFPAAHSLFPQIWSSYSLLPPCEQKGGNPIFSWLNANVSSQMLLISLSLCIYRAAYENGKIFPFRSKKEFGPLSHELLTDPSFALYLYGGTCHLEVLKMIVTKKRAAYWDRFKKWRWILSLF